MWSEESGITKILLIFRQVINATHNVINENMAGLPFINNSTFAGYLHSKVVTQLFRLDLLGSMLLCLLPRWYDTTLPNWALTSPILGFLQCSPPSLILIPLGSMVLTSHRNHTLVWVSTGNMLIEPWCFFSTLQLGPGSFLVGFHCCLERIS